jgi:hypothetical protein
MGKLGQSLGILAKWTGACMFWTREIFGLKVLKKLLQTRNIWPEGPRTLKNYLWWRVCYDPPNIWPETTKNT